VSTGQTTVGQHRDGVTKVGIFSQYLGGLQGPVLDVGCGVGELTRFAPKGLSVIGVDVHMEFCRKAKERGERTVQADTVPALPFKDGAFDAALCSDVFEHLVDPLHMLLEIRRVMRAGALLFCHVPNEFSWKSVWQVLRGDGICNRRFFPGAEEWNYPHIRFFSHKGFRAMLREGGFMIEADLTDFGRGWRRRFYPLFGSGPSFVARRT
jgi:SAM-dependent methyltransferase